MNQAAARAGKPWIDGAIERLDGVARVFDPATGPCYECTMSEVDWKMLEARRTCALLTRDEMEQGKVPTTPTTSSVVAGIQSQEAVKLLHGMDTLSGQGFVFDGTYHQSYVVNYTRKKDCPCHEADSPVEETDLSIASTTAGDFLELVRRDLGSAAVIELSNDLLESLTCSEYNETQPLFSSLGKVKEAAGRCPTCNEHRTPNVYYTISDNPDLLDQSLSDLGVPLWDVLAGRNGVQQKFYEFGGDESSVIGDLGEEILIL